jgi:hypothetical protein
MCTTLSSLSIAEKRAVQIIKSCLWYATKAWNTRNAGVAATPEFTRRDFGYASIALVADVLQSDARLITSRHS